MFKHFYVLDAFRGFAAIFVFLLHMPKLSWFTNNSFINNSEIFVDFFFVLSGFVIFHNYKQKLTKVSDLKFFLKKRFKRLVPLHIYALFIILILELVKYLLYDSFPFTEKPFERNTIPSFFTQLFLLNATPLSLTELINWNGPSWSVSAEIIAYIVFAFSTIYIKTKLKKKVFYPLLFIVVGYLFFFLKFSSFNVATYLKFEFIRGIIGFYFGVLTYQIWQDVKHRLNKLSIIVFNFLELITISILITLINYATLLTKYFFIYHSAFSILLIVFTFEKGYISSVLKLKVFQKLGLWSYSIYLNHLLIVIVFTMLIQKAKVIDNTYIIIYEFLALLIVCFYSSQTYKYIEAKFYKTKKRVNPNS